MTDAQRKVSTDLQEISNVVLNIEFIFWAKGFILETQATYLLVLASDFKLSGSRNIQKTFKTRDVTSITTC